MKKLLPLLSASLLFLSVNLFASDEQYLLCDLSYHIDDLGQQPAKSAVLKVIEGHYIVSVLIEPSIGKNYYSNVFKLSKTYFSSGNPELIESLTVNDEDASSIEFFGSYISWGSRFTLYMECSKTNNFKEVMIFNSWDNADMSALEALR